MQHISLLVLQTHQFDLPMSPDKFDRSWDFEGFYNKIFYIAFYILFYAPEEELGQVQEVEQEQTQALREQEQEQALKAR